jgi:heptaprenyl diphosphate synthase
MNTKKLTTLAMLTAVSLILFVVESYLPPLVPVQGVKLGLANIITLIVLLLYTPKDAFYVLLMRIILSAVLTGNMMSLAYSAAGGLLCFLVMSLLNTLLMRHYIFITSIFGAVFHNIGQILIAYVVVQSASVLIYIPILLISGVITGLFTGLCAHFLYPPLKKALKNAN